jgi:hypothetical protein
MESQSEVGINHMNTLLNQNDETYVFVDKKDCLSEDDYQEL